MHSTVNYSFLMLLYSNNTLTVCSTSYDNNVYTVLQYFLLMEKAPKQKHSRLKKDQIAKYLKRPVKSKID